MLKFSVELYKAAMMSAADEETRCYLNGGADADARKRHQNGAAVVPAGRPRASRGLAERRGGRLPFPVFIVN